MITNATERKYKNSHITTFNQQQRSRGQNLASLFDELTKDDVHSAKKPCYETPWRCPHKLLLGKQTTKPHKKNTHKRSPHEKKRVTTITTTKLFSTKQESDHHEKKKEKKIEGRNQEGLLPTQGQNWVGGLGFL